MKLLLLFTLLSFACHGQHPDTGFDVDWTPALTRITWNDSTGQHTIKVNTPELSLEEKLLLYAQECYNDSALGEKQYHKTSVDTATCQRNVGFGNVAHYGQCEKPSHYYRKYVHRKPTFEGFIEWLRKQK